MKNFKSKPLIYLVDDDTFLSDIITYNLKQAGYDVEYFESATKFLKNFSKPDVLILDYNLGENSDYSGLEVLQAVRNESPELPILMFSSSNEMDVAPGLIKEGVFDYVQKNDNIIPKLLKSLGEVFKALNDLNDIEGDNAHKKIRWKLF